MTPKLAGKHVTAALGFAGALGGGSLLLWPWLGVATLAVTVSVGMAAVAALVSYYHRGLRQVLAHDTRQLYQQIDARIGVEAFIKPRRPLPPMGGVVILPDFANLLVNEVIDHQPRGIVELGSGVSTIILGYLVQRLGQGHVYSFDHLKEFAGRTEQLVEAHSLSEVVTVQHAPLTDVTVDDQSFRWYDPTPLKAIQEIDLLIVDGPPERLGRCARYPALPVLHESLRDRCMIILDDAARPDDREMIDRWMDRYQAFQKHVIPTEKGTVILKTV